MLTKPADLTEEQIASSLRRHWGIQPTRLTYAPLGAGSHHWFVETFAGTEWFATLDRHASSLQEEFRTNSYRTAVALRAAGLEFVHAPTPDRAGHLRRKANPAWTLSVFGYLDGRVPEIPAADRVRIAEVIGRLHRHRPLPEDAMRWTPGYLQDELKLILANELGRRWTDGPFGERARALATTHAAGVECLLERSDALVERLSDDPQPLVVSHGQPWDAMLTADGVRLVDWDACMVAPPERDLLVLLQGDRDRSRGWDNTEVVRAYRRNAGDVEPRAYVMDVFRSEWNLMEICRELQVFSGPHDESADVVHRRESLNGFLPSA